MSRFSQQTLGKPFQIYSEVSKAGKTLAGSKVRVSWRFGWTDGEGEHEIVLVHSLVSGKKIITEDGRKIVEVANIMQSDFSHGWNSSNYIFRVEIGTHASSDSGGYVFSVDGVRYSDMMHKSEVARQLRDNRNSDSEPTGRSSTGKATNNNRAPFQSPGDAPVNKKSTPVKINLKKDNGDGDFDPFGGGGGGGDDDPFGSGGHDPFASSGSTPKVDSASKGHKKQPQPPPQPAASLLDDDLFDSGSSSSSAPVVNDSFDPFGGSTSSNDPFGSSSGSHPPPSRSTAQDFSADFASISFGTASPSSTLTNNGRPVSATSSDPFNGSISSTNDPFGSSGGLSISGAPSTDPFGGSGDFTNMSFPSNGPTSVANPFSDFGTSSTVHPPTSSTTGKQHSDPASSWLDASSNLVNLDLNDKPVMNKNNTGGLTPSLGLLLQGSETKPLPQTGMNAPPRPPMMSAGGPGPMGGGNMMTGGAMMGMGGGGPMGGGMGQGLGHMPSGGQMMMGGGAMGGSMGGPMGGFGGGPRGLPPAQPNMMGGLGGGGGGMMPPASGNGMGGNGMGMTYPGMLSAPRPVPALTGQQLMNNGGGMGNAGVVQGSGSKPGSGPKSSLDALDVWKM